MYTITDSDDQTSSPRRPAPSSAPRNAEELASHVLHGSLRLTPSRQQILSYSGISLPDGPPQLLNERSIRNEHARIDDKDDENEVGSEEGDDEEVSDDGEEGKDVRIKRRERTGGTEMRQRRGREKKGDRVAEAGVGITGTQLRKASDSYVQQIKKRALKIQKEKVRRMAAGQNTTTAAQTRSLDRRSERTKTATKKALAAMKQQNDNISLAPTTATDAAPAPPEKRRRLRGSYSSTRSGFGSSSSIIDVTTAAEYTSDDRVLFSPLSDSGLYHNRHRQKLDTLSVPSASSLDDLTVKSPLQHHQQDRGRKNPRNVPLGAAGNIDTGERVSEGDVGREERGGNRRRERKRTRRGDGRSNTRKRRRVVDKKSAVMLNGVMNGGPEYKVVLWDLVWAKCRGYPPYPALVSAIQLTPPIHAYIYT